MKKRLLVWTLCLSFALTMIPISVMAESETESPLEEITGDVVGEETGYIPEDDVVEIADEFSGGEEIIEPVMELSAGDVDTAENDSLSYDDLYYAMEVMWYQATIMEDAEDAGELWGNLMALWDQIYSAEEQGTSGLSEEEKEILDTVTNQICMRLVELGYDPYAVTTLDDISAYTDLMNAINGQTGVIDIIISNDLTAAEDHITLESGADVTIDLNGYTITADDGGNGALFTIPSGAVLTIRDSQANAAVKGNGVTVAADDAGQLASVTGTIESGITLTYYVTESTVTNSATGETQETCYPYTVNSAGMICSSGQNHSLFSVTGGTLNIKGGFFYGESTSSGNRAIDASSGTVNLSGGYICGFTESYSSGHGEDYDGGAVRITDGGVLNISEGAVLAANKAATGGAVDVADGSILNMTGGVISGNEATEDAYTDEWNNDYGGGGIHAYGSNTVVNISGGYVTNNVSDCTGYFDGGGGILLNGATLNFSGGYITGNKAASSGGGIRTAFAANEYQMGSNVFITGGYLCANYAGLAEGGGLNLDNGSYGEITAANGSTIYINNNETATTEHWGGGGVFCANGATLYMNNALITENAAGGFGGGVAGCSTGRIAIADDAGAAIYGNTAQGEHTSGSGSTKHDDTTYALNDPVFLENSYQDYYCALESMVSGMMLGGGAANWHGSADGEIIDNVGIDDYLWATYIMGLTADPNSEAIASAQSEANVYITGNSSYTHGGGVLSNGYLFMGNMTYYAIGDALEIVADKQLINQYDEYEAIEEGQFTFEIMDENGDVVSTGTTQSDGSISFNRRLTFQNDGTFTFTIKETASEDSHIITDESVYTLVVTVRESDEEVEVSGSTVEYTYFNITHITLTKSGIDEPLINEDVTSPEDEVYSITVPSPAFVNYEADEISITVQKIWQNGSREEISWPEGIDEITVRLYQNGEVYGDAVTLTETNPSYTWTNLPTSGTDGSGETIFYAYEVIEDHITGYLTSYEVTYTASIGESYWIPISELGETELTPGERYLIVSPDGNTALSLTESHTDAQLDSTDTAAITPGEGELTVGDKTFSSWYSAESVADSMIWTATTSFNYNDITYEHIILKNVKYSGSSLLVQGGNGEYTGLKTSNGDAWGSAMSLENGYLIGQYDASSWQEGNPWSYIIYADGRFNSSTSDSTNAVQVYVEINPITENADVNISNRYMGVTQISGEKTWDDQDNINGDRPESITINLLANGEVIDSVAVTEADGWMWAFTDLDLYDENENLIVYTIQEEETDGYIPWYDGNGNVTNSLIPEVGKYVSDPEFDESTDDHLKGDEADNNDTMEYLIVVDHVGHARDLVIHDLLDEQLDISTLEIKSVTLFEKEGAEGHEIEYTETEGSCSADCGLEGCSFEIHIDDSILTNLTSEAYIEIVFDITLKEEIDDFDENFVDEVINHVGLSFMSYSASYAEPDEADTYSYGFDIFKYTGSNEPLEGAEFILSKVSDEGIVYAQFDVTDGVYLLSGWTESRNNATPIVSGSDGNAVIEGLHDGVFHIEETKAPGGYQQKLGTITVTIAIDEGDPSAPTITATNAAVDGSAVKIENVVTSEEIPDLIQIVGTKTWIGDNEDSRPESITVRLYADGELIRTRTVSMSDSWRFSFTGLDKYGTDGHEIAYTIEEEQVPGYSTEYDGYDITNTYNGEETETIEIPVTKVWDDEDDADNIRPESITVELYLNGEPTGQILILDENNGWFGIFTDLEEETDGVKNVWTIMETTVEGYESVVSGDAESGFVITNMHTPEEIEIPEEPDIPDEPEKPENPEKPEEPETPETPQEPDEPENPGEQVSPEIPDEPETSDSESSMPQTGFRWNLILCILILMVSGALLIGIGREIMIPEERRRK